MHTQTAPALFGLPCRVTIQVQFTILFRLVVGQQQVRSGQVGKQYTPSLLMWWLMWWLVVAHEIILSASATQVIPRGRPRNLTMQLSQLKNLTLHWHPEVLDVPTSKLYQLLKTLNKYFISIFRGLKVVSSRTIGGHGRLIVHRSAVGGQVGKQYTPSWLNIMWWWPMRLYCQLPQSDCNNIPKLSKTFQQV